jgi:hypothetical protein
MFGNLKIGGHKIYIIIVMIQIFVNRLYLEYSIKYLDYLCKGCVVCWCCPCSMYNIFKRADEDLLVCCWPMTLWSLRTKIRTLFRIRVC